MEQVHSILADPDAVRVDEVEAVAACVVDRRRRRQRQEGLCDAPPNLQGRFFSAPCAATARAHTGEGARHTVVLCTCHVQAKLRAAGGKRTDVVPLVDDQAGVPKPRGRLLRKHEARQAGAHDDKVVVRLQALQAGHGGEKKRGWRGGLYAQKRHVSVTDETTNAEVQHTHT